MVCTVRHADGLGALGLAGVDGDNAAADGLGHIGAGIDGDHQNGRHPYAGQLARALPVKYGRP